MYSASFDRYKPAFLFESSYFPKVKDLSCYFSLLGQACFPRKMTWHFYTSFPSVILVREKQVRHYTELRMMDLELSNLQSEEFKVALVSPTAASVNISVRRSRLGI